MEKIPTLYERDAQHKVIDHLVSLGRFGFTTLDGAYATEKLDGTNVRLTVRRGTVVRVEARQNPTKEQKASGIFDPWYRDAAMPADKHIFDAVENTDFRAVPDGEWSGEAVGPSIQGNRLELEEKRVVLFSDPEVRSRLCYFTGSWNFATMTFEEMRMWLFSLESLVSPGRPPEGVVFWRGGVMPSGHDVPVAKLKLKDFG